MKKAVIVSVIFVLMIAGVAGTYFCLQEKRKASLAEIHDFMNEIGAFENSVIDSTPIFDDWKGSDILEMRSSYIRHGVYAKKYGFHSQTRKQAEEFIKNGDYVELVSHKYYFYGVSRENRYLTKDAASVLDLISERFESNINKRKINGTVSFAVSSALRVSDYQRELKKTNVNAINESTHSYGVSFDIFFDDYYALPLYSFTELSEEEASAIRRRCGYLIGDSLRRQFKTILSETLVELQREKKIMIIYEGNQRCFHVTPWI